MIRVTVELVPHGVEDLKETLGVMTIFNTGRGTFIKGDYAYAVIEEDKIVAEGCLEHKRKESFWKLIEKISKEV